VVKGGPGEQVATMEVFDEVDEVGHCQCPLGSP
jgi:hypothetical protein